ncbi:MAG: hypothetical protein RR272_03850 [Synergistaceae bacterium]
MVDSICTHEHNLSDYECLVVTSEMLTDRLAWITFKCDSLARIILPGHSVMVFPLMSSSPLLGRPFGVADVDINKGELSVCYMVIGRGTELMSQTIPGSVMRVRGPFGKPLPKRDGNVYLCGGGVGVAIFLLYRKLYPEYSKGLYLGIPGKGFERFAEKIHSLIPDAKIYTDDNSFGEGDSMFKVLPHNLSENKEEIWACGPEGFLKALERHCPKDKKNVFFALDNRMACGYGGCMGCVIETKNGMKRICVDQSLFSADEVNL